MSGQIIQMRLIALAVPLFMCGVVIGIPPTPARADDCAAAPHSVAPKGSHWYYRLDREKRRKCWYLAPLGQASQYRTAKGRPAAKTVARASAVEKPATASAGAPTSASSGDSAPPSGSLPTDPAPVSSAIPWTTGPLATAAWQTTAQAAGVEPAAPSVWPDATTVAPLKAQEPNLVLSEARADPAPPTVRAPDNSQGSPRGGATTTPAPVVEASPAVRFVEILLVAALGLAVAGLLYRVVLKMGATRAANRQRSPQVRLERRAIPARVARQSVPAWIPQGAEEVIDDLPPSLVPTAGDYRVPTAGDYRARRPLRGDDERQNGARGKDGGPRINDAVSGRETKLTQLIQDLEQLLQSRKEA
jgi:hypothetical protein